MRNSADEVQKATAEKINDGGDYSYITDEVLESIEAGEVSEKSDIRPNTTEEVNTLTYQNGRWYFREQCNVANWFSVGSCTATRITNCTNGLIRHRITY